MKAGKSSLQIILVLSMLDDIPDFITHVMPVKKRTCGEKVTRKEYFNEGDILDCEIYEQR